MKNIWKISAIVFAVLFGVIFFREHYPVRIYHRLFISAPAPEFSLYQRHYIQRNKIFEKYDYKNKIVFIGDSHMERCEWLDRHGILNLGIGFDTTHGILNRLDFPLSRKPKCIFIMIGTNDINEDTGMDIIKANYSKIIDKILKSHVQLFVLSTLRMNKNPHGMNFEEVNKKTEILNNYLMEQCKWLSLPFIDLNGKLSDRNGLLPKYSDDGLHMNDEGYVIWENILLPYINKIQ